MSYHIRSCFILLKLLVTCNLGVKVSGLSSLSQQKLKEIPPKKTIVYCCYEDMVSPMYDESYDEVFQGDCFDKKFGQGHPVLIYINNKLEC